MGENNRGVIVLGAGGHAKVVISTLQAAGYEVAAALDNDPEKFGNTILGVLVKGAIPDSLGGAEAIIAIGDNAARRCVALRLERIVWLSVVHPAAWAHPSAQIGPGTAIFAGVIIQPDCVIGAHTIINTAATIDHDCRIGNYVHLAPGVHLAGNVTVGDGAFLGIGSVALPGAHIGAWAIVGAGATVIDDLPDSVVAVGTPARPIRQVERGII